MKTEVKNWYCIYVDYHDKSHFENFNNEADARSKMRIIKKRMQKSSSDDTVTVFDKKNVYAIATELGTEVVLVMNINYVADCKLGGN